jgi:hypothetical protein
MFKSLVSLVVNVNRVAPIQPNMSTESPSYVKPKKHKRNKYRHNKYISPNKRNHLIISALKKMTHIDDIVEKYKCSTDYVAYLMFLHRYTIYEITKITGVTKHRLLEAYLRY